MKFNLLQKNKTPHFLIDSIYYFLFGFFFFFILFKIYSPDLLNLKLQAFFAFDSSFFDYYSTQNNGKIILLSNFFLQFLYYPISGSLLITALLLLLALIYRKVFELSTNSNLKGIEFIPAILILASLKTYSIGLEVLMIFLITGLFLIGNIMLSKINNWIKIIYQIVSLTIAFFVFDLLVSSALLVFLLADEIFISKSSKKYISASIIILLFATLTYLYKGMQISKAIFYEANPSNPRMSLSGYWSILLFHILTIFLIAIFSNKKWIANFTHRIPIFLRKTLLIIILAGIIAGFYHTLFVYEKKYNVNIEYYASTGDWNKVLDYKNAVEKNDRISIFLLNNALYHTGKMAKDLFIIPQKWGEHTLFMTMIFNRKCPIHSSDLYFDMGFVKASAYWALESQTNHAYSPRAITRLANCNILLKEYPTARKYISILNKSLIYKETGSKMLAYLNDKKSIELKNTTFGDREIEFSIAFINNKKPDLNLIQILNSDPNNKMAFEFLLSYHLLRNDLGQFNRDLKKYIGLMNYPKLPKLYQEALLLYYLGTHLPYEQYESIIDKNIINRLTQFNQTYIAYKMNARLARKDLYRNFGDTYWYYIRYVSPKTTGGNIKKRNL